MKKFAVPMLAVAIAVVGLVSFAVADCGEPHGDEVTLEGQVICAKCSLGEEREECQNVLVVKKDDDKSHYYIKKNAVNSDFGDVCMKKVDVKVTGVVEEADEKMWIAPSKIEKVTAEG